MSMNPDAAFHTPGAKRDAYDVFTGEKVDEATDFIRRYASDVCNILRKIDPGPVLEAVAVLYDALIAGKVVMFCGNGGSGASCSHIVNDFVKGCGLKAICLNDSMPLVSAIANDLQWECVFAMQVQQWAEEGCVLVALSGSGNSDNVRMAVNAAKSAGCKTIGLTGFDGGALKQEIDISIHVPTNSMQQAEDVHMVILHMLYLGLKSRIGGG